MFLENLKLEIIYSSKYEKLDLQTQVKVRKPHENLICILDIYFEEKLRDLVT